ncbi:MAG: nucleotidyl transferase AbiEii/AbiGii toxin family protein [Vicinamibacteria bacterium]
MLAPLEPAWTLSGGGALVGFYLKHRETKDLDLFWHGKSELGNLPRQARDLLRSDGLEVSDLQTSLSFHQFRVSLGAESCIVDLVADPSEVLEAPRVFDIGAPIEVDTPHEILVNKLCALLGRAELRDLIDVRDLLAQGGALEKALRDAPRKDGGFSPLTLAWVMRETNPAPLARALGWTEEQIRGLSDFHSWLIEKLIAAGTPE